MTRSDFRAQRREQPEPEEGDKPIPVFLWILVPLLIVWGVLYIASQVGSPLAGGDARTQPARPELAAVNGEAIYAANCAACHQSNGQGLPGSFPPLAGSEWVQGDAKTVIAIVTSGLAGEIEVSDQKYDGVMPPFGRQLSNDELAAVISYIRDEWGNSASSVTVTDIENYRERHPQRSSWKASDLASSQAE